MLPSVHTSRTSRSRSPLAGSTWKLTRLTGEKSASRRMALMGSASGSRRSAGTQPRPRSTHTSISSTPSLSRVARGTSGVRISTSASASKSPALTDAHALGLETEDLGSVDVQPEHDLAEMHEDVQRVLHDPLHVRELVQHVLDLHPRRRRAVDGGQQHPAVGVAHRQREPRLERLDDQLAVGVVGGDPLVAGGELELQHEDPLANFRGAAPNAQYSRTSQGFGQRWCRLEPS